MNRTDCAYLIHSTPSYYYLLPLHITLLKRYAPTCKWPICIASEVPDHPMLQHLVSKWPDLKILPLTQTETLFFQCRLASSERLPPEIQYVLPMQEDFLLEGRPIEQALQEACRILDESPSVQSLRLMPCPGPAPTDAQYGDTEWRILDFQKDPYVFTYQATIWRREAYAEFFRSLLRLQADMFGTDLSPKEELKIQVHINLAEISKGQDLLQSQGGLHLACPREGSHANAVYLSPWPYRPTAVVKGELQEWAEELAAREGVPLRPSIR